MTKPQDPVCGMWVDPTTPLRFQYKLKMYYFCNPKCQQKFEVEPSRYLFPTSARGLSAPAKETSETIYTCPMHPLVRQKGFGFCPDCGMDLEPAEVRSEAEEDPSLRNFTRRFGLALALSVPILILSMFESSLQPKWNALIQLFLTLPILVYAGAPFYGRAWAAARRRKINMFSLIALGTGVAFLFSLLNLLFNFDPAAGFYFESTAVILTMALLGQMLELRSRAKTGEALRALMRLTPSTVTRVTSGGEDETVDLAAVTVGELFRVRPGEAIATDGEVIEGGSLVEESLLTGEATPVPKAPGDAVTGGTLNGSGRLLVKASRVGADTVLAQIVRLVNEAQRTRAPIQNLADRWTAIFVPTVLAVALLAGLGWMLFGPEPRLHHAVSAAVSVLIIACPCALGLATPISMMVATMRGAREGLLIRKTEALEALAQVSTLAVDKTGTLTVGHITLISAPTDEALRIAASLEQHSEHPLASAFLTAAHALKLSPVEDFNSFPGRGVQGRVDGLTYALGNAQFMAQQGLAGLSENKIYLSSEGRGMAEFQTEDALKPDAFAALSLLRKAGLNIVLLSGDHAQAVEPVAKRLGITDFHGGLTPEEKAEYVRRLRTSNGGKVAFAGDGINDAPALAQADVGLAFASGADVAKTSSGITLTQTDLHALVRARELAQQTMRNIKQNMFFAFVYNGVGIVVAAGVLYPFLGVTFSPVVASVAMSLSSVSVIGNALRLRRKSLKPLILPLGEASAPCCD